MAGIGRGAHSPAFTGLPTYLKTFFLPQTMRPLDVHTPAFSNQQRRNPSVAESRPAKRQPMHVGDQRAVLDAHPPAVALGAAGLADRTADTTLGIPQPFVKMLDDLPTAGWGQEFFAL